MPTIPDPAKLQEAAHDSYEHHCKPYREKRTAALAEAAGAHYGKGDTKQRPTNLIAQFIEIMEPALSGSTPACEVTPKHRPDLEFEAELIKMQLDFLAERNNDAEFVSDAVVDAIVGPFAVAHCGLRAATDQAVVDDREKALGEPFEELIDLDDFFWDRNATKDGNLLYEGHFFTLDREVAIACEAFGRDPGDFEPGEYEALYGLETDEGGNSTPAVPIATRAEAAEILKNLGKADQEQAGKDASPVTALGNTAANPQDGLGDQIKLMQVALYIGGQCWRAVLPAAKGHATKYLVCEPWQGPSADTNGPYEKLRLRKMPKHIAGLPLVAAITDLHDAAIIVSNKIVEQTKNLKVNWVVRAGEEDLAAAVEGAADRQYVIGDPTAIKELQSSVLIKDLFTGQEFIAQEWANHSGNAPLVGGQTSEGTDGTATAATYLQENSTSKINKKRALVAQFVQRIIKRRAWYIITDPLKSTVLPYRMPGGETQEVTYSAENRRGAYQDFVYRIRPQSMPTTDPVIRGQRDIAMLSALPPVLQLVTALGGDVHAFMRQIGRRFAWDDMDQWLPDAAELQFAQALAIAGPQDPRQPAGGPAAPPQFGAPQGTPTPQGKPTPGRPGAAKTPASRAAPAGAAR